MISTEINTDFLIPNLQQEHRNILKSKKSRSNYGFKLCHGKSHCEFKETMLSGLEKIGHIRIYTTQQATNTLVCSLVLSRLDYCYSLQTGLNNTRMRKLQQI